MKPSAKPTPKQASVPPEEVIRILREQAPRLEEAKARQAQVTTQPPEAPPEPAQPPPSPGPVDTEVGNRGVLTALLAKIVALLRGGAMPGPADGLEGLTGTGPRTPPATPPAEL